ncbi:hypothetical protein [Streptomyces sp. CRN 30]|uniref:hypothetical protein n=1 Tax=Streptomyces sp. CRN 30 TaxID=3075613 RepID=UPI002A8088C3|nr:hypothetical protein [Streptomyces sp. CRN 30]
MARADSRTTTGGSGHPGLDDLMRRPLLETVWRRRTHRVARGAKVLAGSMTYTSQHAAQPLSELEEAVLVALTGSSGLTMPDRPFEDEHGTPIMAKPNLTMTGRTAGSPDNAQGTHFFLINDTGTYYLRKLDPAPHEPFDADTLIARARESKVRVLDHRLDVATTGDRDFPAYLDSNRFLSNREGTTLLFPVVDLSHQYINALMYLLTQPKGARPTFVDDRNLYRPAGVEKWVRRKFLNKDIKVPLGVLGPMRTQIEADLLLQNLMLAAEAMGLGAWIHASINPVIALGHPEYSRRYGRMLGFTFVTPRWQPADVWRWNVPLPKYATLRSHPVALRSPHGETLIEAACPPAYASMSDAVQAVFRGKFGTGGTYSDQDVFNRIYRNDYGKTYLAEAREYDEQVVECAKDVCEYVLRTHHRFPAHTDAIHVPGVWLQVHHVETEYYERFFAHGLTEAHRAHAGVWDRVPATPAGRA